VKVQERVARGRPCVLGLPPSLRLLFHLDLGLVLVELNETEFVAAQVFQLASVCFQRTQHGVEDSRDNVITRIRFPIGIPLASV